MVTNHISSVLKQALKTFVSKNEQFYQNLEALKMLLDKTTANDVNLQPQFLSKHLWIKRTKAPVTYVHIYDDYNLSVGIFILKPGMVLPLHDHPHMYGLIKVIAGTIKITSFSVNTQRTEEFDKREKESASVYSRCFTAEKNSEILASPESESCLVEPNQKNLHEIECVGGPAAFIDVLSPPYESDIPNIGPRKCSYYRILNEVSLNVYKLEETSEPSWYWNDVFPYTGPKLFI